MLDRDVHFRLFSLSVSNEQFYYYFLTWTTDDKSSQNVIKGFFETEWQKQKQKQQLKNQRLFFWLKKWEKKENFKCYDFFFFSKKCFQEQFERRKEEEVFLTKKIIILSSQVQLNSSAPLYFEGSRANLYLILLVFWIYRLFSNGVSAPKPYTQQVNRPQSSFLVHSYSQAITIGSWTIEIRLECRCLQKYFHIWK